MKGGQKYVRSNLGGARNCGANRPVTRGSGGVLPQKIFSTVMLASRKIVPWSSLA